MKKIFFVYFFLFSFFLFSCSSGNSVRETSSKALSNSSLSAKPTSDDFRDLYEKMVKSPEYIDYSSEVDRFVSDMNYSGDNMNFKTNDDLLNWIEDNIAQTNFGSFESAKERNSKIKDQFSVVYKQNSAYFSTLSGVQINDEIISIVAGESPVTTLDKCGCTLSYNSCMRGASKAYMESEKDVADGNYESQVAAVQHVVNAFNYMYNKSVCSQAKGLCLKGCN